MDKHALTEFQRWSRPLIGQPDALTEAYALEDVRDNALREYTLQEHEEPVSLWLCALSLLAFAFAQGRSYSVGGPEPGSAKDTPEARIARGAYGLRLQLLGLTCRASKPALDLTLSGYYTEAWTLLRTMLDGWGRCLFVRLKPEEHGRWYAPDDELTVGEAPRKPAPNWGEIGSAVATRGSNEDKVLFKEAQLRWELLHMGTHPSGEGIEQVRNDVLGIMMYRPEYHPGFCMYAFSLGVFVQRALLREVGLLGSHPDWWLRANAKHASDIESLAESIRPALDQVAEILEARREARRLRRRNCRGTD